MKKFENFQEFTDTIINAQRSKLKNINCYLMPNEITALIENSQISYLSNESTLQIIVEHDRFVKVYFYGNENFSFIPFSCDKPIITDLPYAIEKGEKFQRLNEALTRNFALNSSATRMMLEIDDTQEFNSTDMTIDLMTPSEIDDVYQIWEENFDPNKNLLQSKAEIARDQNPIYVLKDKDGGIFGVSQLVIEGKNAWIQKIAIKRGCQGLGLGGILEKFCITLCKSLGIKKILIYTIDGDRASSFHKKYGFYPDGKHTCQYILRR